MADMMKKVPVREQDPKVRATNFEEVCLGYNKEEAMEEATRCLNCKNAKCIQGCPVSINIPAFIHQVKEGNIEEAYKIIGKSSALPAICGRVCPQESQCEGKCIRGVKGEAVSIGKLERFVADYALEHDIKPVGAEVKNGHKVAVIGSGPSGLTCAGDLAKAGYDVTVFEALHELGGVLVYGIPEFRLPKQKVVKKEIEKVKELGVKFETNVVIGKSTTIDQLIEDEGFEAVFIGSGAGLPMFMGIPGENASGVFSANEYLTRSNLMKAFDDSYDTPIAAGKKVAVVGGGNVAMDAARTALRLGAEVHIVYRRSEAELPARAEEVHHAKEEGVQFDLLCNPVEILTDPEEIKEVENRAKVFLRDVFASMNLGEVEITSEYNTTDGSLEVDFEGEDMGILIGKRGQTLDSLQYLTSLVVNKGKSNYIRVKLDTEDYRKRRKETLENLARGIAYKVRKTRKPVILEPMNPYERRIIHSALQGNKFVETVSEGEEPYRHVVVKLKRN